MKHFCIYLFSCFLISFNLFSQTPEHWENIIDASDTWKYLVPSAELPSDWTDPDFDDAVWSSGPGGIGYGDNDDLTILPDSILSVFLRKNFFLADSSTLVSAFLYVDYDDAFVAYLNGIEIARANIGTVNIRPAYDATSVNTVEPAIISGNIPFKFPVDTIKLVSALKNGINTLALQFHNQALSSSDLSSTTYFFGGFSNSSGDFRSPPSWFIPPPSLTSHLPIIVIDTWGGTIQNEPKINAWIKIINKGPGQINNISDPGTDFEGNIGIEVRGQSSQMFPKLSYGFETHNQLNEDSAVSLIGMPEESDWILSAPYSDKTMMRNPFTYYLGNQMSYWQPHTQWCELFLNDSYQGVYLLVEKIKRDKNRVSIDRINPPGPTGDSITGGYIVKVDKLDGLSANDYFRTYPIFSFNNARRYDFTYVYPKSDEIQPAQKIYIKNFLTDLETSLNGPDFKDPVKGFRSYIDVLSFAEFQIIQEISNNVDGYRYSTFFNKESDSDGGKLIAGPLWDFDLCYGNVDYSPKNLATNQWLYINYGPYESSPMHWWIRLMQDADYQFLVKKRYSELREGPFNTDSIMAYLDNNEAFLGEAITRNFKKWPILDEYIWPNYYIGYTYDNEMDYLKTWISDRLTWMDSKWLIPLNLNNTETGNVNFKVYPNPFSGAVILTLTPLNTDEVIVDITNLLGQKLLSRTFKPYNTFPTEMLVDHINLPSGIYFLTVHQSGQLIAYSKLVCSKEN